MWARNQRAVIIIPALVFFTRFLKERANDRRQSETQLLAGLFSHLWLEIRVLIGVLLFFNADLSAMVNILR